MNSSDTERRFSPVWKEKDLKSSTIRVRRLILWIHERHGSDSREITHPKPKASGKKTWFREESLTPCFSALILGWCAKDSTESTWRSIRLLSQYETGFAMWTWKFRSASACPGSITWIFPQIYIDTLGQELLRFHPLSYKQLSVKLLSAEENALSVP